MRFYYPKYTDEELGLRKLEPIDLFCRLEMEMEYLMHFGVIKLEKRKI